MCCSDKDMYNTVAGETATQSNIIQGMQGAQSRIQSITQSTAAVSKERKTMKKNNLANE